MCLKKNSQIPRRQNWHHWTTDATGNYQKISYIMFLKKITKNERRRYAVTSIIQFMKRVNLTVLSEEERKKEQSALNKI